MKPVSNLQVTGNNDLLEVPEELTEQEKSLMADVGKNSHL